jgi:hypothetical protein
MSAAQSVDSAFEVRARMFGAERAECAECPIDAWRGSA